MKFLQKTVLLSLLCMITSICSIDHFPNSEFPSHETDTYHYEISKIEKPMTDQDAELDEPIKIWTNEKKNLYKSGIIRTERTVSTENNMIVVTTEKWTTKNSSYFTLDNALDFLVANWFLNNPTGKLIYGDDINIPWSGALIVGALHGIPLLANYLNPETNDISQNIADTVKIEKTTLGSIAQQKNMLSKKDVDEFIAGNKENWTNIPVIKITAKFTKDATRSYVTLHIKDQNLELKTSRSLTTHQFINDAAQ